MAVGLLLGIVLGGCQSRVDPDTPPEIRYGEDICDQCRMIISEPRYAAAYVTRQSLTRRFDDIGDLLLYHARHREDVLAFWVHDYETEEWLKAPQAFYVMSPELHTPMAHGIVALRERARAAVLAAEMHGRVFTFVELQQYFSQRPATAHSHQHTEAAMTPHQRGSREGTRK